ncbi:DUF4365 domain-containing protein [Brevibacillus sp. LEMMJ03]|nr:DUF4365 domain-containing protein [Brevibacillus sp. LEMMJ03]
MGIQLKHGNSYFKFLNQKPAGDLKLLGKNKHLNYYLNSQSPIFIIIMDNCFKRMHWVELSL